MKIANRREFLFFSLSTPVALAFGPSAFASGGMPRALQATAITQVFGDGIRLTALAIEYDVALDGKSLSAASFSVDQRTVTGAFVSASSNPKDRAENGRFVIVTLSADDADAALAEHVGTQKSGKAPEASSVRGNAVPEAGNSVHPGGGADTGADNGPGNRPDKGPGKGPGNAGDIPSYDTVYRHAQARVTQLKPLMAAAGATIPASPHALTTTHVENLIVDDFKQLTFHDSKTGRTLRYNLFVPHGMDKTQSYPLVLFMHDAGATSDVTRTTLFQGLGAIAWASPEDQAKRPCFVLAPQYGEIIADDASHTSSMLDTTTHLIEALTRDYPIDRNRLYATGQSGGCMMSIAMGIRYPKLFAASFLVAGQWDPALVKPLAQQKLWILVSQDDDKAWPGENAIVDVLEKDGAKISRAVWSGEWDKTAFRTAFDKLDADHSPINYVAFRKGTVIPPGTSTAGASGHRNTWRIAYTIEPIREWIFRQSKAA